MIVPSIVRVPDSVAGKNAPTKNLAAGPTVSSATTTKYASRMARFSGRVVLERMASAVPHQ